MNKKSKRYRNLKETYKNKELKTSEEVIKEIKKGSGVKFVESIDLSLKINLKKIKGAVIPPSPTSAPLLAAPGPREETP